MNRFAKFALGLAFISYTNILSAQDKIFGAPSHRWRLVNDKHWQVVSDVPIEPLDIFNLQIKNAKILPNACSYGMVHVSGNMKQDPNSNLYGGKTVEEIQKITCTKWINREFPERCAEFDRTKWISISRNFKTAEMNFCIDTYEYPNQKGQNPLIFVNWNEAQSICKEQGKRLCSEKEWTFACEGEEATPYPYGYSRDAIACVIDKQWQAFSIDSKVWWPRNGSRLMMELDHLWQGEPSGSRPRCKSSFGVYDLTGNVDEWTSSSLVGERPSILKGGYFSRVRNRCRPSTRSHSTSHTFYQQGLRCCSDVIKSIESQ